MKEGFRSVIWSGLEEAICRLSSANKFCKSLGSAHEKRRAQLELEIEVGCSYIKIVWTKRLKQICVEYDFYNKETIQKWKSIVSCTWFFQFWTLKPKFLWIIWPIELGFIMQILKECTPLWKDGFHQGVNCIKRSLHSDSHWIWFRSPQKWVIIIGFLPIELF